MPTLTCFTCGRAITKRGQITCCRIFGQRSIFTIRRSNLTPSSHSHTRDSRQRRVSYTTSTNQPRRGDRKSTRLNSSHSSISYAVFCLKKKKKKTQQYNSKQ